jgi:hypothetical protein
MTRVLQVDSDAGSVDDDTTVDEAIPKSIHRNSFEWNIKDSTVMSADRVNKNLIIAVLFAIAVTTISSVLVVLSVQRSDDVELLSEVTAKHSHYSQDDLFKMAKSVDEYCHPEQISTANGRLECQQICHDHICCFDIEDSDDCHNYENDLCMIFAPCEVLFVAEDGVISSAHAVAADDDYVSPEVILQEGLEWQQARENYINEYCAESNIKHERGRNQCAKVCANHFCCFDTSNNGENCLHDKSMICDAYSACEILLADLSVVEANPDDSVNEFDKDAVLDTATSDPLGPTVDENIIAVPPDMIGDALLPALMTRGMPVTPITSEDTSGGDLTAQELLQMKDDIQQRCSDYQTSIGRLHCEKVCNDHLCCFAEDGCQDDPAKLCQVYNTCKVLATSASAVIKDEVEGNAFFQMDFVSPEFEVETEEVSDEESDRMPTNVPTYVSSYLDDIIFDRNDEYDSMADLVDVFGDDVLGHSDP